MKTKRALKNRAIVSSAYLLISAALLFVFIIPLSPFTKLSYRSNSWESLMILAAACIYLAHFIYGSFVYPITYRKHLTKYYLSDTDDLSDWSYFRGYIAMCIVPAALYGNGLPPLKLLIFSILFILVNIILNTFSKTSELFSFESVMIDARILMPWKDFNKKGESAFATINYLRPLLEDECQWQRKVVARYVSMQKEYHDKMQAAAENTKQREAEATEATKKMVSSIHS